MTVTRMLALFAVVGAIGCASGGASGSPRNNPNVITREELAQQDQTGNAYDVIQRLRPGFLVSRGQTTLGNAQVSPPYANVYLDGMMYGDINSLKNIDAQTMAEVRMYQAWEAQTKFGVGNNNGVIAITTHR